MYNINCLIYINRCVNNKCEVVIFLLFSIPLVENYIYIDIHIISVVNHPKQFFIKFHKKQINYV